VATDKFAMRGFDYRGNMVTLILAKSFENEREAMQALNRVGRFGDDCKRILLESVPLLDDDAVFNYNTRLQAIYSPHATLKLEQKLEAQEQEVRK
jgi:hypothetical protein